MRRRDHDSDHIFRLLRCSARKLLYDFNGKIFFFFREETHKLKPNLPSVVRSPSRDIVRDGNDFRIHGVRAVRENQRYPTCQPKRYYATVQQELRTD